MAIEPISRLHEFSWSRELYAPFNYGDHFVPYAVVSENKIVYLGEDRAKALEFFDANPNARLERPDSLEALSALLNGDERVKAQAFNPFEALCDTADSAAVEGLGLLDVVFSQLKSIASQNGINEDFLSKWLQKLECESKAVDQQTKEFISRAGEWFIELGTKLKNDN